MFFILFDEKMMMYLTLRGYLHNTNMKTFSLKILGSSEDEKCFYNERMYGDNTQIDYFKFFKILNGKQLIRFSVT